MFRLIFRPWRAPLLGVALVSLSACSAFGHRPEPPTADLTQAEAAIAQAEREHVDDYDALSLSSARKHLAVARALAAQKDRQDLARWMAAQAIADAQLAEARASLARERAYYEDLYSRLHPGTTTEAPKP